MITFPAPDETAETRLATAAAFLGLWAGGKPPDAYINIAHLSGGKVYSSFHTSLGDAAQEALRRAKMFNVYFSVCALRKPAKGRGTALDAVAMPGLWLDVDIAGPGHSKKGLPPTLDDALRLVARAGLPPSVQVASGGGLHTYWLADTPWDCTADRQGAVDACARFAGHMKAHANLMGYSLDNVSDLARILRVPGTFNRKGETPRPVEILTPLDCAPVYSWGELLDACPWPAVDRPAADRPTPPRDTAPHFQATDAQAMEHLRKFPDKWNRVQTLMAGDANGFPSPSEAWYSLLAILVGFTDDPAQVLRLVDGCALPRKGTRLERQDIPKALAERSWRFDAVARPPATPTPRPVDAEKSLSRNDNDMDAKTPQTADTMCGGQNADDTPPEPPSWAQQSASLADAMRPRPPMEYIVKGLLPRKAVIGATGPPACHKTNLFVQLGVSVAHGVPFLEGEGQPGFPVTRARVGLLNIDSASNTVLSRAAAHTRAIGYDATAQFTILSYPQGPGLDLRNPGSAHAFEDWCAAGKFDLLIIDCLAQCAPGADENSVKDMGPVLATMRHVAESQNACVVFLHHTVKNGERSRGSGVIESAVDLMLSVSRPPLGNVVQVCATKCRNEPVEPFACRYEYTHKRGGTELETARFTQVTLSRRDAARNNDGLVADAILTVLAENPDGIGKAKTETAAMVALPQVARAKVRKIVDALVARGDIEYFDNGGNYPVLRICS